MRRNKKKIQSEEIPIPKEWAKENAKKKKKRGPGRPRKNREVITPETEEGFAHRFTRRILKGIGGFAFIFNIFLGLSSFQDPSTQILALFFFLNSYFIATSLRR